MARRRHNFKCDQGADFGFNVEWLRDGEPIVITDARMMIRKAINSPDPMLSLEAGDGHMTIVGAEGKVVVGMSPAQTAELETGVYDLEIVDEDDTVVRLLQGKFIVAPEVTR